ncbi:3'-5' exonuclease family protein [Aetokthonos hydrillicola]|jgi:hypothetical protein|uniref:hypothetical protein n=1 Tax=Aetokthonos hydrillicola TaxID=1550245 RepID=UPI001ABA99D6|nr:hypothetical protein [Aetokthonos hydrillicola]MBO3457753.1 hypothetical protein [Aetokthonos hydrillicola CCALA 1050]MBW4589396.1 hypothetical protein [Aetokthonos hydrillicola CCALA 1050]
MFYLTRDSEIQAAINEIASCSILWLDTEVADCFTPFQQLSLIQVLSDPNDLTGESVYLLDVFNQPDIVEYFIAQIMRNANIEKIFHNSNFDLKYLGGTQAQNITCTLKMARKISRYSLGTSDLKLKTLARELCNFTDVDSEEGTSDWGRRPLIQKQLNYAKMDTVYLAQVHLSLKNKVPNKQLPLVYESVENLDNSDELNFSTETENMVNRSSDSASKSLKEKCQELIDLSQRKINLKKYADQLEGFTARQKIITNSTREIQPLVIALKIFSQKGIINLDLNQKVDILLNSISFIQDNFRKNPEWILDNNNFKANTFNSRIDTLKNSIKQDLSLAWKNYLKEHLPTINREMLDIFGKLESLKPTIDKIYALNKRIQEIEFPKNVDEFDEVDRLIGQLKQLLDSLSSDKIPEDVQKFLKIAANQGATIDLLTTEVKEWLIEHRLDKSLRIRLS